MRYHNAMQQRSATLVALAALACSLDSGVCAAQAKRAPGARNAAHNASRTVSAWMQMPLRFEANTGQTAPEVQYLAKGAGYSLFLTPQETVFRLEPRAHDPRNGALKDPAVLRMKLVGGATNPSMEASAPFSGVTSYFLGNDPARWRTGTPTFKKVRYQSVYPGIDLVYYGNQSELEYDFVIAPGANPNAIRLQFSGLAAAGGKAPLRVDARGELALALPGGEVRWRRPVIYQRIDGTRRSIGGRYVVDRKRSQVQFQVARYDRSKPLVIDPVLAYSTFLGGKLSDAGYGIATDSMGNAFVSGTTASSDFPMAGSPMQATVRGKNSAFVAKLNRYGGLLWATYLGGKQSEEGRAIAVDTTGNVYVTGSTSSPDFPTTPGAFQMKPGGGTDGFVTKLNPTGSQLIYSTYLGGEKEDNALGIAVDEQGNAYVAGRTASAQFPTTSNAFQKALNGLTDAFLVKLSPGGSSLLYATYVGGKDHDAAFGVAIDRKGNAYLTGGTFSNDFPTTASAFQSKSGGGRDAFLTKIDTTQAGAASLVYSTYLGGSKEDSGNGIAAHENGHAVIVGSTASVDFPASKEAFQKKYGGGVSDGFAAKFDTTRSGAASRIYATFLGGVRDDIANGVALDHWGNAYISGSTKSYNFPVTKDAHQGNFGYGVWTAFLAKLGPAGERMRFATFLRGGGMDYGVGVAVDRWQAAYVTGLTNSKNFPVSGNAAQTRYGGNNDAFVMKLPTYVPFDFDGDGKPDILWQNQKSGAVVCWVLDGSRVRKTVTIEEKGHPDWRLAAAADLNGDGKTDLIWQHRKTGAVVYWLMDGLKPFANGTLEEKGHPEWRLVAAADLNGDGKPDLLWQNEKTGAVVYWLMDGLTPFKQGFIEEKGHPEWKLVGVGDINNDGKPDLIWQNAKTGAVVYWLMDGLTPFKQGFIEEKGHPEWQVAGIIDLKGDGRPDMVWQNVKTGAVVYWIMDGAKSTRQGHIEQKGQLEWRVVGIH